MMVLEFIQSFLAKIFYKLTQYYPRRLPDSKHEISRMQFIMTHYLGLELGDGVWYTVLSQMMAGRPTSLRKSYASMVNAGKKLKISKLVQDHKIVEHENYLNKLKETTERVANEFKSQEDVSRAGSDHADVQNWARDLQGSVQGLQNTSN